MIIKVLSGQHLEDLTVAALIQVLEKKDHKKCEAILTRIIYFSLSFKSSRIFLIFRPYLAEI